MSKEEFVGLNKLQCELDSQYLAEKGEKYLSIEKQRQLIKKINKLNINGYIIKDQA